MAAEGGDAADPGTAMVPVENGSGEGKKKKKNKKKKIVEPSPAAQPTSGDVPAPPQPKGHDPAKQRIMAMLKEAQKRAKTLGAGGIECVVTRLTEGTPMGFDFDEGLVLRSVKHNSPADDAGMSRFIGMKLRAVNGARVTQLSDCIHYMNAKKLKLGLSVVAQAGGMNPLAITLPNAMPGGTEYTPAWGNDAAARACRPGQRQVRPGVNAPGPPMHILKEQLERGIVDEDGNPIALGLGDTQAPMTRRPHVPAHAAAGGVHGEDDGMPAHFGGASMSARDATEINHLRRENSRLLTELSRAERATRATERAAMPQIAPPMEDPPEASPDRFDDDEPEDEPRAIPESRRIAPKDDSDSSDSDSSSSDSDEAQPGDMPPEGQLVVKGQGGGGAMVPAGHVVVAADQVVPVAGQPGQVMLPASVVASAQADAGVDPNAGALVVAGEGGGGGDAGGGDDGGGDAAAGALVPFGGKGKGRGKGPGGGQLVPFGQEGGGPGAPGGGGGGHMPLVLPVRSNLAGMGHVVRQIGAPALRQALDSATSVQMPAAPAPILTQAEKEAIVQRFNSRHPISMKVQKLMAELDTVGLRVSTAPLPHVDRDFSIVVQRRIDKCKQREAIIRHFDRRHPVNAQVKERLYQVEAGALHTALGPLPHTAKDFSDVVLDRIARYEEEGVPEFDDDGGDDAPLMVPAEGPDGRTIMVDINPATTGDYVPAKRLPGQRVADDDWRLLPSAKAGGGPAEMFSLPSKPKPRDIKAFSASGLLLEPFQCEKLWVCSTPGCGKYSKGTWFLGSDEDDYDLCSKCAYKEEAWQAVYVAAMVIAGRELVNLGRWKWKPPPVRATATATTITPAPGSLANPAAPPQQKGLMKETEEPSDSEDSAASPGARKRPRPDEKAEAPVPPKPLTPEEAEMAALQKKLDETAARLKRRQKELDSKDNALLDIREKEERLIDEERRASTPPRRDEDDGDDRDRRRDRSRSRSRRRRDRSDSRDRRRR